MLALRDLKSYSSSGMGCFRLLLTCLSFSLAYGQWTGDAARKRINKDALEPEWHWVELPLDHFNVLDNRTFRARYQTNDQFYKKGGPIIVYIGGEWKIAHYGVMGGVAFQLARRYNGYLFYPEHRYFGESLPFPQLSSVENLRYLTPDHSLADLMYSLDNLKRTVETLRNSQVIMVGGSYAGTLAIWARLKYPHIVSAAYNCGGVINNDPANAEFYQVVYDAFKKVSPTCLDVMVSGINEAMELFKSQEGTAALKKMWKNEVCSLEKYNLAQKIFIVFNPQIWPVYKPHQLCHFLETNTTGSPLERLYRTYKAMDDKKACPANDTSWLFIVCTFTGNVQYTNERNFGKIIDLQNKIKQICLNRFGSQFTKDFLYRHTYRSQLLFGSNTPDVTKVLSVQGTHDPWKTRAIIDELNDYTPVVYIQDAWHCLELGEEQDDETPQVAQSKLEILEQMSKWIM